MTEEERLLMENINAEVIDAALEDARANRRCEFETLRHLQESGANLSGQAASAMVDLMKSRKATRHREQRLGDNEGTSCQDKRSTGSSDE